MAKTGADLMPLTGLGILLIVLGAVVLMSRKPRP
jgi:LPXTG-motif cell wall-anchored protein